LPFLARRTCSVAARSNSTGGTLRHGVPFVKAVNAYRAKAFECLSLAECVNDAEGRAEMVRFARVWMKFTEPIAEWWPEHLAKEPPNARGIAWH
jgi:hypothetical protein